MEKTQQIIKTLTELSLDLQRVQGTSSVTAFIFLGPEISADGTCSHEIKRRFLLGRKAMANLEVY